MAHPGSSRPLRGIGRGPGAQSGSVRGRRSILAAHPFPTDDHAAVEEGVAERVGHGPEDTPARMAQLRSPPGGVPLPQPFPHERPKPGSPGVK